MQTKLALAVLLTGSVWLAGCATGTTTQPPVEDQSTSATTTGVDGQGALGSGTGNGTRTLPDDRASRGETLPGTAPDADLLAKRRVHFEFDSSSLDDENRRIVEAHARYLASNPNLRVTLEGHADERGTREYNLALGERRSQSVERVIRLLGVSGNRLSVTSYGEEKPLAPEHNESAWALNRRVEILYR